MKRKSVTSTDLEQMNEEILSLSERFLAKKLDALTEKIDSLLARESNEESSCERKEYYTIDEVCRILGVTRATVINRRDLAEFPFKWKNTGKRCIRYTLKSNVVNK